MSEGSEILDTYQKEYDTLHETLLRQMEAVGAATGEQKKLLCHQTEAGLEEMDEIISQMEVELASLSAATRMRLAPRVRASKEDIKKMRRDYQKATTGSERDQLLGGRGQHVVDFEVSSQDQRSRLLNGTERLQEGSRRLEDARRLALETEVIGISTLDDLNRQREQIYRTRDTLSTADTWIAKSQGALRGMQRRMIQNKILSFGIIIMLVIVIIAIIWLKWF
ncbi:hypothetical protein PhCBS80983_g00112 [Powellomyces hirtus]|uniref:Vesicle transport v-SNARE N-terminal domain-containing protein n=1 Tax=Powellomyces hirtus TaxID=109895 RepID=A0A507EGQ1_9FUNG|nr:hypothetical protein DFJ77DRAFT_459184 [Powellomyces hirtus]TPX62971.1 hypothetical protein PhCBS80983_g00112 [Powellomyces hirtus]